MILKYKDSKIEIPDEIFLTWTDELRRLDSLITQEAREDLFGNASLDPMVEAFRKGSREYELSDNERKLILTLVQMHKQHLED